MTTTTKYIDDFTGDEIDDKETVYELTIKDLKSNDVTVSHISDSTRSELIQTSEELASVFLHD